MEYVTIGESCSVVSGGTPSRSKGEFWLDGTIPWIKIGNIKTKYVNEYDELITEEGLNNSSAKLLKKGTILYTIFATLGEVGILDIDACTNQAIAGITINDPRITPDFLYYYLKSKKEYVNSIGRGVAQNNINLTTLRKFEIPLIDRDKQSIIVKTLEKVEKIIDSQKKELDRYDELVKARFVEMFGTIHDNKFEYDICTIQSVCEQIKDGTHQTPEYTDDIINGFKFLSSKDVTSGKINWDGIKYIPECLHNNLYKRIAPRKGDILLAKNGTTGVAAIVDVDEIFDIYVSLALLRPIEMNSIYLCAAINSQETKEQFNRSLKGIGVPNLHLGEIKKTKILNPPIKMQNEFANFVAQVDKSKLTLCRYNVMEYKCE